MTDRPFPKRIARDREHDAAPGLRFHLILHAHPKLTSFHPAVAAAIWQAVLEQRAAGRVELFASCLMPDHLHLLVGRDKLDILQFVNAFKSWTTRRAWQSGHRGVLWQPRMWDRTINDPDDFDRTVEYIVRNPVEAESVDVPAEWGHVWAWYHE